MSENNSQKSPVTNSEVSPIRNLFRKNDTAAANAENVPEKTENKAVPETVRKTPDNKDNAKNSYTEKQNPTVKDGSEIKIENGQKTKKNPVQKQDTKPETNKNQKSEPKSEKSSDKEKQKDKEKITTEEKNENKNYEKISDEKSNNSKSEKEPEQTEKASKNEELKLKENTHEENTEVTEKVSDTPESSKKQSPFGKLKSKIKDIIMSMKQPEEETEPQIEDIFSSSGNFVREKNADPLDADAEYKENVIYTAPKEEKKHSDDSVIFASDALKAAGKNTESKKAENDKNDIDITEILNSERAEKNTSKPEKNKTEKPQPVKSSEQKTDIIKSQQNNNIKEKNIVQKSTQQNAQNNSNVQKSTPQNAQNNSNVQKSTSQNAQNNSNVQKSAPQNAQNNSNVQKSAPQNAQNNSNVQKSTPQNAQNNSNVQKSTQQNSQNISVTPKSQTVKPYNNDTATKKESAAKNVVYQTNKSDKQAISENKPQNIKKPVDVHSPDTKIEEKTKTPVENIKTTPAKADAAKPQENKNIEYSTPTQPKVANALQYSSNMKSKEHIVPPSDNTAKIANEKPKNDVIQKQNVVNTQKSQKADVADINRKNIPETSEPKPLNNTSKIDGDNGIKILPWTPKKDVSGQKPNIKAPDTKGKNLSEGSTDVLIYHYNKTEPFVIMAGKFTKTLKSEYEEVRKFNSTPLDDSVSAKPDNASLPTAEKPIPKNTQQTKSGTDVKTSDIKLLDNEKKQTTENHGNSSSQNTAKPVQRDIRPSQNTAQKISEVKKPVLKDMNKPPVSDVKKQNEKNTVKKSAAKKTKKPKKNYNFRNIFSSEEEYDPEDVEKMPVKKSQLDDYTNEKDSETIRTEIAENFRHVFTRTGILFVTTIISIIVSIIAQCVPSLFNQTIRNGWLVYAIINFLLFTVSVVVSRVPIVNGIMALRHFKGNSDTAVAVASFAVAIQSIVALFSPNVFVNGTLYIYSSLVILALFLNSLGKLFIILRTYNNFRFLSKPRPKYAGKIYTDIRNAEKISSGLPSKKPIIAYMKKSKFMSNFLQLSYAPDPSEDAAAKIAPYAALLSLVCGILYGVMTRDFVGAVSSFALSACITIPICSLLAVNIPLKRLCHNSIKGGAMVTSYETVKQFCDTNVVMVDSSQLYPPGTVTLSGIKAFKESRINDAITAGAAIMFAVNGTMSYIFENIIQDRKDILPKVESVIYEDGMGLVGWINGQRVLIGNRRLLEAHNITPPEKSVEDKYLNMGNQVTYISMSGELVAMFILSYTADREIMHELRNLEDNGVSFTVRTVDPNITQKNIAEKFCLFFRCIKILPTSLGNICHDVTSSVDDKSRAYLVTRGKIASFARAVSGCIRIKSNITLSIIIQYIAVILGILIVTLISFISGFEKLGCLEMLLYIGFWAAATIIIPLIKK